MIATHVIGPSHVLRWRKQVLDGVLKSTISPDSMYGHGGLPIWSKSCLEWAKSQGDEAKFGVLVGDFRFGNGICLADTADLPVFQDGFLAVERAALDETYDRAMYRRSMMALQEWGRLLKGRGRFALWDLFCRQVQDRLAGRHIGENGYRHPVWNLDDVMAALPELEMVDLRPLLKLPMHEVSRLFIDESSHPSLIGYVFLELALLQGVATMDAYHFAVAEVEQKFLAFARRYEGRRGKKLVLTGASAWLDTLTRYMGANGQGKLADAGLIVAPINKIPGRLRLQDFEEFADGADVVILGGEDLVARVGGIVDIKGVSPVLLQWEPAVVKHICFRKEKPSFDFLHESSAENGGLALRVLEEMVELGPHGFPNFSGLMAVLEHIFECGGGVVDFYVENEVLVSKGGVAYLIGGNHSVLEYAKGELVPPPDSFENFSENLSKRKFFCESKGVPYLHVIFPDKQSVLEEEFPVKPVVKLGNVYREKSISEAKSCIVYPVAELKEMQGESFYPLDTHLTDAGSLVVLEVLLKRLGISAGEAVARIRRQINRPVFWSGDLGNKLSGSPKQKGLLLEPDWRLQIFNSPGKSNDGSIDILISPDAQLDKTLLLFGDSFFRMMLKQFSAIFRRVICLRTRYFHPEMMLLMKPDYVLTGNAERYLSFVSNDKDANAFFLYGKEGMAGFNEDVEFLRAFRAVTSPDARESEKFFEEIAPNKNNNPSCADTGSLSIDGMRVLVATHHIRQFGGSEIFAMELADEFARRGARVELFSPFMDKDFCQKNVSADVGLIDDVRHIDLTSYDLCYSQHQVLAGALALQADRFASSKKKPVFVYGHLSSYEPMEFPGPWGEELFADIIICNSAEALTRLRSFGEAFQKAQLFQNPAPASFSRVSDSISSSSPKKVLVVAHSLPDELAAALTALEDSGVRINIVGRSGRPQRVDADLLQGHDLVVTMGKTVQYALRAGVPVYCYGRFGGPGWLSDSQFSLAEHNNFSGRGFGKKSPEMIVSEIVEGYEGAVEYALRISRADLSRFSLESRVDELIEQFFSILQSGSQCSIRTVVTGARKNLLMREYFLYLIGDRRFR